MMDDHFDPEKAKEYLLEREKKEKEELENKRKILLEKVTAVLKEELRNSSVEAYLVGSIIKPFGFSAHSDIDIVLKNFKGDRFAFWSELEKKLEISIEIIPFETCSFQEFVLRDGLKVV